MRILLAEDDLLLGDGIRAGLRLEGDTVEWVTDGVAAENALVTDEFDLLVLDIGLPRRSGLDILRNLRHQGLLTPVLLLTARDKVADRVAGLDSGADDYLTKPFDLDELQARVRALTRLFMCHDYTAPGRDEHRCETSVGEQRRHNVHVREGVDEEAFVAMRQQRDATLGMPTLMLPAIQVNMRGGNLPPVEGNGVRYLKIPLDLF